MTSLIVISTILLGSETKLQYLHGMPIYKNNIYTPVAAAKSLQSCPTLCNPIDGSPPGSPDPGILQARTLEWVAISFSNTPVRDLKKTLEVTIYY